MKRAVYSDSLFMLSFFIVVIAAGTALLSLPAAWAGPGRLKLLDALFTATSAVCVTGLATVDTTLYTRLGQTVIAFLIQIGGLGIISFTSILLIMPGSRLPFRRLHTIRSFSLDGVEHDPVRIVRDIVLFTLAIEGLGALALSVLFSRLGVPDAVFAGVFHSISAFCNAGFSVFADGMRGMSGEPAVLLVIVALVVTGGIGFIVLSDAARVLTGRKRSLAYHSRLMLCVTAVLIAVGTLSFWLLERTHAFAGMAPLDRAVNALFQSVTPRTAGFDTVAQSSLSTLSKFLVVIFMFIGGAPGSIAGGIKISTAFVVVLFMLKQVNEQGEINSLGRRFTPRTINAAVTYFVKAAFLVVLASGLLSLSEGPLGARFDELFFEAVSAFGTVGLSLGLTPSLSIPGKAVIIGTMFIGRVGLLAYLFVAGRERVSSFVYPEASVLIG